MGSTARSAVLALGALASMWKARNHTLTRVNPLSRTLQVAGAAADECRIPRLGRCAGKRVSRGALLCTVALNASFELESGSVLYGGQL